MVQKNFITKIISTPDGTLVATKEKLKPTNYISIRRTLGRQPDIRQRISPAVFLFSLTAQASSSAKEAAMSIIPHAWSPPSVFDSPFQEIENGGNTNDPN